MELAQDGADAIDALPYIDTDYDQYKSQVQSLIQDEMRRFAPKDYLRKFQPLQLDFKDTVFLKNEFERIARGEPMPAFDVSRYSTQPPQGQRRQDPNAWKVALEHAEMQLAHQHLRLTNLELMESFGANAWKFYNNELAILQKQLETSVQEVKAAIDAVNVERQKEQSQWHELLRKNNSLQLACLQLEHQLKQHGVSVDPPAQA